MRRFNTSGPCDPDRHYTVMREELVAKGQGLVEEGRFFTLFAPRQSGKTTYFQLLSRQLKTQGYTPIWISFEGLKTLSRAEFYQTLTLYLHDEFAAQNIQVDVSLTNQVDLQLLIRQASAQSQPIVLIIDEFEDGPDIVLNELMHTFRAMYQKRDLHKLHSLILVGVSTIAELILSSASPFNVVDELRIPYFSSAEVESLIAQYVTETGQPFDEQVVQAIAKDTAGQPGLVCALCGYLVTEMVPDISRPVKMDALYATLTHFLTERFDKNIVNIVQKANKKREFMLKVLFGTNPIPFTIDNPDIAFLFAHGVVTNNHGAVDVPVPLYSKRLIEAFRPPINGETQFFVSVDDGFGEYFSDDGLNMDALLKKYNDYVRRRGFRAFDTEHLREGAWHYSLDGFINFVITQMGGDTFVEVPSGRGRTDILVLHDGKKQIIETKIFSTLQLLKDGKRQLADYLDSERLDEGYYVVFSNKHSETDTLFFDEVVGGKRIFTYLIRTNFEQPSQKKAQNEN